MIRKPIVRVKSVRRSDPTPTAAPTFGETKARSCPKAGSLCGQEIGIPCGVEV